MSESVLACYTHYALDYFTVRNYQARERFDFSTWDRPRTGLVFVEKGEAHFVSEDVDLLASAGDWVFIPLGATYQTHWRGAEISYFTLDFEMRRRLIMQHEHNVKVIELASQQHEWRMAIFTRHNDAMERELAVLTRCFQSGEATQNVLCAASFYRLWYDVLCAFERIVNDAQIARAVSYIDAHPLKPLDLPALYRLSCLSQTAFFKRFRAATGLTPVQYRNHLLTRMGEKLLSGGEYTLSQVAEMLGLCSADYLTVLRKKYAAR